MTLTQLILTAAATAAAAVAQEGSVARIGFDFEVNGKSMPAGKYEVKRPAGQSFIHVRDRVTGKSFFVPGAGTTAEGVQSAALIFSHEGNRYVLEAINTASAKLTVRQSRRSQEMAKNVRTVTVNTTD
jgi:hypothetical protein